MRPISPTNIRRFLFVVLGAYKQMHLQSVPVLSDVNADNFDTAFDMFRPGNEAPSIYCNPADHIFPVIFGLADSQHKLTDKKVQDVMEICQRFFDPNVDEADVIAAKQRYGADLIRMQAPVLGKDKIDEMVKGDAVGERVLRKFDALKVFGDDVEAAAMGRNPLLGYRANVKIGELGLIKDDAEMGETEILVAAP